jgi:lipoprotein NlpD
LKNIKIALVTVLALAAACTTRPTPAPVVDARAPKPAAAAAKPQAPQPAPATPKPTEGTYVVKRGDTLYSIALEHGVDYRELAQWNHLDDPAKLRIGQALQVKPVETEARVQVGAVRPTGRLESRPLEALPTPAPKPSSAPASAPAQPPQPASAPAASPVVPKAVPGLTSEPGGFQFVWPAKGKIITAFAEPRNKGIDIDGRPGDPVVAAAAGRVTYMGSGIPGLGKLVVLKHENGFITVYAHNRQILVKEQQHVARGQKIAELGERLHFQIRKGAAAVDPLLYLPK